ncbi:hypothetical protein [Rhizosphaericola mali]|uniref:Lipocalin-like domain-containing protein n=1 Tax=Rhizosphaericola mali TaxID=2545455 RepID=A0A5P2G509_9BACT|nr:hypothetical protein [Rhizosphaericola mali]QES88850.1 hypothetical protein E0W69_009350 [Rhizosphaericola mali]
MRNAIKSLFLLSTVILSCSKDKIKSDDIFSNNLIGTWRIDSGFQYHNNPDPMNYNWTYKEAPTLFTFNKDGSYIGTGYYEYNDVSTYTILDSIVITRSINTELFRFKINYLIKTNSQIAVYSNISPYPNRDSLILYMTKIK